MDVHLLVTRGVSVRNGARGAESSCWQRRGQTKVQTHFATPDCDGPDPLVSRRRLGARAAECLAEWQLASIRLRIAS